jgi:glycosyltransferase involved in cell wall biosynthesis
VDVETHFTEQQANQTRDIIHSKVAIEDRNNTTVLVFAANNFRLKGLRDLLIGMSLCQRTAPNRRIVLVVAGSANQRRYLALARRCKIENNVYFHGYTDNIQSLLAVCDAAVLPSYYDPCSRFILEALAMNIPVLTTRYNGASEYYIHHRHGVILERPDDILPFADGLAFLSSPENRQAAAQAIKEDQLVEKLSIKHHCRKIAEMYNVLLKRKENA